ncbi:MAG: histidine kinase [Ignavibacteriales bacterium]|nr:histidine kinase [Ignavibacteriales bacterium]
MRSSRPPASIWILLTIVCVPLALAPEFATAQTLPFQDSWRWAHFTTESGLPSNQVFCITETPGGTIWAGTENGVAWFDGYVWNSLDNSYGIPADLVSVIEPYGNDSVFCIVKGSLYLGSKKGFKHLVPNNSTPNSFQSIVLTKQNQILILGGDSLFVLNPGSVRPVPIPARPISTGTRNLWRTRSGSLWVNTVRGLYKSAGDAWTLVMPVHGYPSIIQAVVEDQKGNGIAAVVEPREFHGIREWKQGGLARLSATERSGGQLAVDVSPSGDVLVCYATGEIRQRHKGEWSSVEPRPKEFTSTHALKFGKSGDLWVGTEQGLYHFQAASDRWTYWRHPFGDQRNGVHEITRTADGSIWLGTFNGLEIHRPDGRVQYIESILGTTLGTITCITEDRDHNVWVGSGANFAGAFRWNGRMWKHFGYADGLNTARVHKIRKDRRGDLWFLGLAAAYEDPKNQPGAFQYKGGKFIRWSEKDSVHEGLISGRVYGFAEGFDGSFWFATLRGLSRWKNNAWKHWTKENGLINKWERIFALAVDSSGSVWFANEKDGLGTVSNDGSVRYLTTSDGLINDQIRDLRVDEKGVLWISTARGLSCYNKGVWSSFTVRNGLSTPVLWDIFAFKNRVYVGSPGGGVNILNRPDDSRPPKIVLMPPSFQGSTAILRLKAFPYFGDVDPDDVEIRYRIDNEGWSGWSTQREIERRDLASGDHSIEVQAKGLFGDFAPTGQTLTFPVEPGLLSRPPAVIALVLLVGSFSILGGAYLRRKRIHQKALRKSDERFHLVATTTADVIYDWNLKNGELWVNDSKRSWIPGPLAELGKALETWLEHVHPEDRARLEKAMSDAVSSLSSSWQAEYRFLKPTGGYGHMLHRGHFEFDESDKPVRALGSIMDISERKQAEDLSRSISKRIIEAQEGERRRVSRELHDSVNQILASVKFRIESVEEHLTGRNKLVRLEVRKTKLLLNKVMTEIRRISRNLRPAELDDLGLASAVRSLADEFSERTNIATRVKQKWPAIPLSPEVKLTLYRIIQESLMNVEKHARAKRVRISCTQNNNEITCVIEDNGLGIRTDEQTKARARGDGLGLLDMQERLSFIGGRLEISSVPRQGTVVTIHVPLKPSQVSDKTNA